MMYINYIILHSKFYKVHGNHKKYMNLLIDNIIIDPGFGFGKTLNQNYELINMISKLYS